MYVGYDCNVGLGGDNLLGGGRFFGVREISAQGVQISAQLEQNVKSKISTPNLEDILKFSARFVPEADRKEYETGLRNLFK